MKIILDLCGGTGAWSKPYKEAGYDVRLVTLPEQDVRSYKPPDNVYGILIAPPCTAFASSGARWYRTEQEMQEALEVVYACLSIKDYCKKVYNLVFWALENPVGKLRHYIGKPVMYFQPYEYGDAYTKKTCLWGEFNRPIKTPVVPYLGSYLHRLPETKKRATLRSITPGGFARAFFEANQ